MVRRPLAQRPLRKLEKLELRPEPPGEPRSFAEVMERAGAVPLESEHGRVLRPAPEAGVRARPSHQLSPSFRLDVDEGWIEGFREGLPVRERSRLRGTPLATLDLHGHGVKSARRALGEFLARERELGRERVLVIVGKGLRAPGGAGVLRSNIAEWLSQPPLATHVLAFRTAPREQGGSGAVVVLLARPSKEA